MRPGDHNVGVNERGELVTRKAEALIVEALGDTRVVSINGARHLAARLGSRFVAGYLLYTGQQTLPFGDRLRALPIDALWHLIP